MERRKERRQGRVTVFQKLCGVRGGTGRYEGGEKPRRTGPALESIEQSFESEKKKSRKKREKSESGERFFERFVLSGMPDRDAGEENSNDGRNPHQCRFVRAGIGLREVREQPSGEKEREQHRKGSQSRRVGHGKDSREPKEQRFRERASEVERLSDEENRSAVKQASKQSHRVAGLLVFADVEQYERGGMDANRRRNEDREFLPIGKEVPVGREIQNETHPDERRPDDRKDGNEFRGRGLFGLQTVMRQKPFGLRLGHDSRFDERRHVGGKLLVKV